MPFIIDAETADTKGWAEIVIAELIDCGLLLREDQEEAEAIAEEEIRVRVALESKPAKVEYDE